MSSPFFGSRKLPFDLKEVKIRAASDEDKTACPLQSSNPEVERRNCSYPSYSGGVPAKNKDARPSRPPLLERCMGPVQRWREQRRVLREITLSETEERIASHHMNLENEFQDYMESVKAHYAGLARHNEALKETAVRLAGTAAAMNATLTKQMDAERQESEDRLAKDIEDAVSAGIITKHEAETLYRNFQQEKARDAVWSKNRQYAFDRRIREALDIQGNISPAPAVFSPPPAASRTADRSAPQDNCMKDSVNPAESRHHSDKE